MAHANTIEFEILQPSISVKLTRSATHPTLPLPLSVQTKYQHIDLFHVEKFGKILLMDSKPQCTELDILTYHESLVHPAMLSCPVAVERVLIAGGGDFAALLQVLKYQSVKQVYLVDIDQEFMDIAKVHLKEYFNNSEPYGDPRVKIVSCDIFEFLTSKENEQLKFDIIIMDLSDPFDDSCSFHMSTIESLQIVKSKLTSDTGILVTQADSADVVYAGNVFVPLVTTLSKMFKFVQPMSAHLFSFFSSLGFIMASDNSEIIMNHNGTYEKIQLRMTERLDSSAIDTLEYYDAETHVELCSIPKNIRFMISKNEHVFTRANFTGAVSNVRPIQQQ